MVVVLHANHAHELPASVARACQALRDVGVHLLNQSVLLAGVNDKAEVLCALSTRLFACGVLPYYLHLLDKVTGAAHFDVPASTALSLLDMLRSTLPGYLVPRLVSEVSGQHSKTPV